MAANSQFRITELKPSAIKANLKSHMEAQTEFNDYDFDGSALNVIMDLLVYNTYMNAFYTNMAGNESFMDSAVLRQSVVSRAKELGYRPRSASGAAATVQVTITPGDAPASITIDKGTRIRSTINGKNYTFQTGAAEIISPVGGVYSANVIFTEGISLTDKFTVVSPGPDEKYVINNTNIDLTSLVVRIQESSGSSTIATWSEVTDILTINSASTVFFLEENLDGKYEVYFGDDVLGKKLIAGNIVHLVYRVTGGDEANGARTFTAIDNMGGYGTLAFSTQLSATGGQDREAIESIRFNAPRNYDMQGRAVTENDYRQYVLNMHSDIESMSVWGGEENTVPVYGKVYMSLKPFNGFTITEARKADIVSTLEKINVHSIDPIVVDATFLYVTPKVKVFYDPDTTSLSAPAIKSKVQATVVAFEIDNLGNFGDNYHNSHLARLIDSTDTSIKYNDTTITIQKRFSPILNDSITYQLNYAHPLHHHSHDLEDGTLSSTGFTLPAFSQTMFMDDDGVGNVRTYYLSGTSKVYVNKAQGTINYASGVVKLNSFAPSSLVGAELRVTVDPETENVRPARNQILLIADSNVEVYNEKTQKLITSGAATTSGDSTTLTEGSFSTGIVI